jgi:tRNA modification GTPase
VLRQDTIAAIATPVGTGGIGIIRISGPRALEIAHRVFKPSKNNYSWESHVLYHGDIISADGKTTLDEVLISFMREPNSFTGEDVIEINCHGSAVIMQKIISELVSLGCRLAGPGEFSQRAFFNNKLDLSQAEALAAMVAAPTPQAFSLGLAQLKGNLSTEIEKARALLIEALASLEAAIDFSEDVPAGNNASVTPQIEEADKSIEKLLSTYHEAKIITQGLNVVITGKPNVGKSSLLNALTGKKKAIVTDIPGTTRDLIVDEIVVHGTVLNLMDTAGIRKPKDAIEKEGISLVWENLANADVVLILLDGSIPLSPEDEEIISKNKNANTVIAINKTDLPALWDVKKIAQLIGPEKKIIKISAKFGAGLEELKKTIIGSCCAQTRPDTGAAIISNLRHKQLLERAQKNIIEAKDAIARVESPEITAFELREAVDSLDEITGKKINEEVLDKIFSSFCIGK